MMPYVECVSSSSDIILCPLSCTFISGKTAKSMGTRSGELKAVVASGQVQVGWSYAGHYLGEEYISRSSSSAVRVSGHV